MRADVGVYANHAPDERATPGAEPGLAQLLAELAGAGLVGVDIGDDGAIGYSLTESGQRAAQMMAMSREAHALVLLGALMATGEGLD